MNGYRISEAARATGFSESALRFYERKAIVVPERTDTGYRVYDDSDIDSLRFVARAKGLGISLDEVSDLLDLLQGDECRPVQTRLRQLVDERIEESQKRIADLVSFTARLQQAASQFDAHTPTGGCDDECGCRSEVHVKTIGQRQPIPLTTPAVACSLEPSLVGGRIEDWKVVVDQAVGRSEIPAGVRLVFPRTVDVTQIAGLAVAEQSCCQFFAFSIGVDAETVTLDVTGPPDAQAVITAMFGAAA